jgi:hypothetical protein
MIPVLPKQFVWAGVEVLSLPVAAHTTWTPGSQWNTFSGTHSLMLAEASGPHSLHRSPHD